MTLPRHGDAEKWGASVVRTQRVAGAPDAGSVAAIMVVGGDASTAGAEDGTGRTVLYHAPHDDGVIVCSDAPAFTIPSPANGKLVGAAAITVACDAAVPTGKLRLIATIYTDHVVVATGAGGWIESVPMTEFAITNYHVHKNTLFLLGAPSLYVLDVGVGEGGMRCSVRSCSRDSPSLSNLCFVPVSPPAGGSGAVPCVSHVVELPGALAGAAALFYAGQEYLKRVQLTEDFTSETFSLADVPGIPATATVAAAYPSRAATHAFWAQLAVPGAAGRLVLLQFPAEERAAAASDDGDATMGDSPAAPPQQLRILHELPVGGDAGAAFQYAPDTDRLWVLSAGASPVDVIVAARDAADTTCAVVVEVSPEGEWTTSPLPEWQSCVGGGRCVGAVTATAPQSCVKRTQLNVYRNDAPVILHVAARAPGVAVREKLVELDIFGRDRAAAFALLGVDAAAPDALESVFDVLVDAKLTQLLIKWCQERGFEDMDDLTTLRSLLHLYRERVARVLCGAEAWVKAHAVDVFPTTLDAEYHRLQSAAAQFAALGEFFIELCEDFNDASKVKIAEDLRQLRAARDQMHHALAMHGLATRFAGDFGALGGIEAAFRDTAVAMVARRRAATADHQALLDETLSNSLFLLDAVSEGAAAGADAQAVAGSPDDHAWSTLVADIKATLATHPSGLMEKFACLNETSIKVTPPTLVFDILYHHATLLNAKDVSVFAPSNTLDVRTLFQPLPLAKLEKGCKVELMVPVGAGWSAGAVETVNDDCTFDMLTADGALHCNLPIPLATLKGVKPVVQSEAQEFLRHSAVFYHLLCTCGIEGGAGVKAASIDEDAAACEAEHANDRSSSSRRSVAFVYAQEYAGLPRGWLMFLTSLWVTEFGNATQRAQYPFHMPSPTFLEQWLLDTYTTVGDLPNAVQCLHLCASDCVARASVTLYTAHARAKTLPSLVPMLDVLQRHGNHRLYAKTGLCVLSLCHIHALCVSGDPGLALDVARALKAPLATTFALAMVLEVGGRVESVFEYPLAPEEERRLHALIDCIASVHQKDRGVLSGRLAALDAVPLKVGLYHAKQRYIDVYRTLLRADRGAKFSAFLTHLETKVLPPAQVRAVRAEVAGGGRTAATGGARGALIPSGIMACGFAGGAQSGAAAPPPTGELRRFN